MLSALFRTAAHGALAFGVALIAAAAPVPAQTPVTRSDPAATTAIVERAGTYVDAYEKEISLVVCEEQQVQQLIRANGTVHQRRELKSDFLLVAVGAGHQAFRDVLAVDGKPVPNHEDRLRKLFLSGSKTAVDQAKAIAKESGRYNIGVNRAGNSPMLPLGILTPRRASGFRFTQAGPSSTASHALLRFEEFRSPSYLRWSGGDLMSHGWFDVDVDSGRVLAAEVQGDAPPSGYSITLTVRYREDPALKLLVPLDVTETYWQSGRPKDDRLEVTSTYASFRRFHVTTSEIIKAPATPDAPVTRR